MRDLALTHHGEIGAEPRQILNFVVGMGARDDFQRQVGGARLLNHLTSLEGRRPAEWSRTAAVRRRQVGDSPYFRVSGIAGHHLGAVALRCLCHCIGLAEHHQLPPCIREAATVE
jgi:hypothetical protein